MESIDLLANAMVGGTPHARALGIELVSVEPGHAVMRVPYRDDLVGDAETGVLAGGVLTVILDQACGLAASSARRAEGPSTATLDLRIDYVRAAIPGRTVIAEAHCYKNTASIAFVRAVAYEDSAEDPIATVQAAFAANPIPMAP